MCDSLNIASEIVVCLILAGILGAMIGSLLAKKHCEDKIKS